jgi:toxin ParE1/3/4
MRLEISDLADRDIKELFAYGKERYGERQALTYLASLWDQLEWLRDWPLTSREHTEIRPPVRLCTFDAHNIIYDVRGETLVILRVFHHSADWKKRL